MLGYQPIHGLQILCGIWWDLNTNVQAHSVAHICILQVLLAMPAIRGGGMRPSTRRIGDRKNLNWCTPFFAVSLWDRKKRLILMNDIGLYRYNSHCSGPPIDPLSSVPIWEVNECIILSLIRAPPIVWPKQRGPKMTKVPIAPLINQHWKAKNLSFNSILSYMSLQERRRPY